MNDERAVGGVVAVILLTTVASGPLVGIADLTTGTGTTAIGDGDVTVNSVQLPENATLTKARFGAGGYYLRVPPATTEISDVSGSPRLIYEIEIPRLGYTRSSLYSPSAKDVGSYTLTIERASLDNQNVDANRLNGSLSVSRMSNRGEREIASSEIVVEVVE